MSKTLLISDDGLSKEVKWNFTSLNRDVTKISFFEDMSGKGTCLEVTPRSFMAKTLIHGWHITDLLPVNAAEWAYKTFGPFDLAVIGPNRGLNLGDKCYFSSSSFAMAKILAHYGVKTIVISMDTDREEMSQLGSRYLCHVINQLEPRLESRFILSLNFMCSDPSQAKFYTIKNLIDETNTLFYPQYIRDNGEWYYNVKSSAPEGYRKGTVIFTLLPRY